MDDSQKGGDDISVNEWLLHVLIQKYMTWDISTIIILIPSATDNIRVVALSIKYRILFYAL